MTLLRWPKGDLGGGNEEPPSAGEDSFKLYISGSWDIHSVILGCHPLQAGNNNFRSLASFSGLRRGLFLATHKKNKGRING